MIRAIRIVDSNGPYAELISSFSTELQRLGANVTVGERPDPDSDHEILIGWGGYPPQWMLDLAPDLRAPILKRTFLVNGPSNGTELLGLLEEFDLAGGLPSLSFFRWEPERHVMARIAGLRSAVAALGGSPEGAPFASEHYCFYTTSAPKPLVACVHEYLVAWSAPFGS